MSTGYEDESGNGYGFGVCVGFFEWYGSGYGDPLGDGMSGLRFWTLVDDNGGGAGYGMEDGGGSLGFVT